MLHKSNKIFDASTINKYKAANPGMMSDVIESIMHENEFRLHSH
jgi:hypothetical protein